MRDVCLFAMGLIAAFMSWIYPPFHKIDYYVFDIAVVIILVLLLLLYTVCSKKISEDTLITKAVQRNGNSIIFKVNIKGIFSINSISTMYIRRGNYIEPLATVVIENVQDNNIVQVRIQSLISKKNVGDLDMLEVLLLKPSVNFSLLEGEKWHEWRF